MDYGININTVFDVIQGMSGNERRRDRDSEGDTPKPKNKMAATNSNTPSPTMSIPQGSELGKTLSDLLSRTLKRVKTA